MVLIRHTALDICMDNFPHSNCGYTTPSLHSKHCEPQLRYILDDHRGLNKTLCLESVAVCNDKVVSSLEFEKNLLFLGRGIISSDHILQFWECFHTTTGWEVFINHKCRTFKIV